MLTAGELSAQNEQTYGGKCAALHGTGWCWAAQARYQRAHSIHEETQQFDNRCLLAVRRWRVDIVVAVHYQHSTALGHLQTQVLKIHPHDDITLTLNFVLYFFGNARYAGYSLWPIKKMKSKWKCHRWPVCWPNSVSIIRISNWYRTWRPKPTIQRTNISRIWFDHSWRKTMATIRKMVIYMLWDCELCGLIRCFHCCLQWRLAMLICWQSKTKPIGICGCASIWSKIPWIPIWL